MKPNITCKRISVGVVTALAATFPLATIAQTAPSVPSVEERAEALGDVQVGTQPKAQQQPEQTGAQAGQPGQSQQQAGQPSSQQGQVGAPSGQTQQPGGQTSGQAGQVGAQPGQAQKQQPGQTGAQERTQQPSGQSGQSQQQAGQSSGQQGQVSTLPKELQQMVDQISQTNVDLMLLGLQGSANSQNEQVKKFAKTIGQQHHQFATDLAEIASDNLIHPKIQPGEKSQIQGQGQEFDKQFLQQVMKSEAELAKQLEAKGQDIQHKELSQYSKKVLEFARKQAQQAQQLMQKVEQGGTKTTGTGTQPSGSQQAGGASGGQTGGTVGTPDSGNQ